MLDVQQKHSLIGNRAENQDAMLVKEYVNGDMLLAVADGMGGGEMGAELSQKAVDMLDELFATPKAYPQSKLLEAMYTINDVLLRMIGTKKGGSTLCVVYYLHNLKKIYYINVGDSRLSIGRNGEIQPITLDQNEYEHKKLKNEYADEDDLYYVYRILGVSMCWELKDLFADERWSAVGEYDLLVGDSIVLTTDGFHDCLSKRMACDKLEEKFDETLDYVKEHSGDNITIIVAKEI